MAWEPRWCRTHNRKCSAINKEEWMRANREEITLIESWVQAFVESIPDETKRALYPKAKAGFFSFNFWLHCFMCFGSHRALHSLTMHTPWQCMGCLRSRVVWVYGRRVAANAANVSTPLTEDRLRSECSVFGLVESVAVHDLPAYGAEEQGDHFQVCAWKVVFSDDIAAQLAVVGLHGRVLDDMWTLKVHASESPNPSDRSEMEAMVGREYELDCGCWDCSQWMRLVAMLLSRKEEKECRRLLDVCPVKLSPNGQGGRTQVFNPPALRDFFAAMGLLSPLYGDCCFLSHNVQYVFTECHPLSCVLLSQYPAVARHMAALVHPESCRQHIQDTLWRHRIVASEQIASEPELKQDLSLSPEPNVHFWGAVLVEILCFSCALGRWRALKGPLHGGAKEEDRQTGHQEANDVQQRSYNPEVLRAADVGRTCVAAANTLTILNAAGIDLCGCDLQYLLAGSVSSKGEMGFCSGITADISGMSLHGTDLRYAYLRAAHMQSVAFDGVDLRHADLQDVVLNADPPLLCREQTIESFSLCPIDRWIALGDAHGTTSLWCWDDEVCHYKLEGHESAVTALAVAVMPLSTAAESPSSTSWWVCSGGEDGSICSHIVSHEAEADTGDSGAYAPRVLQPSCCMEEHYRGVTALCISPDSTRLLSGSRDCSIRLWDLSSGTPLKVLQGHGDWICALLWNASGTSAFSGSADRSARQWNVASGSCTRKYKGHAGWVTDMALSPNETELFTCSSDSNVKAWRVDNGALVRNFTGHQSEVKALALCTRARGEDAVPALLLCSASDSGVVRVVDTATGTVLQCMTFPHVESSMLVQFACRHSVEQLPSLLVGSSNGTGHAAEDDDDDKDDNRASWSVMRREFLQQEQSSVRPVVGPAAGLTAYALFALSPHDMSLFGGCANGGVYKWHVRSGVLREEHALITHGRSQQITAMAVCPHSRCLFFGDANGEIYQWSVERKAMVQTWCGHEGAVTCLVPSGTGRTLLLSGGVDSSLKQWNVATVGLLWSCTGHSLPLRCLCLSSDEKYIYSAGDNTFVKQWSTTAGSLEGTFDGFGYAIMRMALSQDDAVLCCQDASGAVFEFDTRAGASQARSDSPSPQHLSLFGQVHTWSAVGVGKEFSVYPYQALQRTGSEIGQSAPLQLIRTGAPLREYRVTELQWSGRRPLHASLGSECSYTAEERKSPASPVVEVDLAWMWWSSPPYMLTARSALIDHCTCSKPVAQLLLRYGAVGAPQTEVTQPPPDVVQDDEDQGAWCNVS